MSFKIRSNRFNNNIPKPEITFASTNIFNQNFEYPKPIINYLKMLPTTMIPKLYINLLQCCKYFYAKKYLLVPLDHCDRYALWKIISTKNNPFDYKLPFNIWLTRSIHGFIDNIYFLKNAVRCNLIFLSLYEQNITFKEFQFFICTGMELFECWYTTIKYNNGIVVPIETIFEHLKKIKSIFYVFNEETAKLVPAETAKNLTKIIDTSKLERFGLRRTPLTFDFRIFKNLQSSTKAENILHQDFVIFGDEDIIKIDSLYENVLSEINNGELGYACVCLGEHHSNKMRKKFVECGLQKGFMEVRIIYEALTYCMNMLLQSGFKPQNGDIIWCFNDPICEVYQKLNNEIKFILETETLNGKFNYKELTEQISKATNSNQPPNFIIEEIYFNQINENEIKEFDQNCQFYAFKHDPSGLWMKNCIAKAKILAGDLELEYLNFPNLLDTNIEVVFKNLSVISFQSLQRLPLNTSVIINTTEENNILYVKIFTDDVHLKPEESVCLPPNAKILVHFFIDINAIYNFDLKILYKNEFKNYKKEEQFFIPKNVLNFMKEFDSKVVGIDLGTTRCCAAVNRNGRIETVALDNLGERLLPSYIAYDEREEKCGGIVINRMQHHSKSTIFDVKRILGKKFEEISRQESWPFEIVNKNTINHKANNYKDLQLQILEKNNLLIQFTNYNDRIIQKHPEEISAALLKHIKQKVDEFQGEQLFDVMITVPAGFTESQKTATQIAALIAGWQKVNLMPEPIAATFAYFIQHPFPNETKFLLFDLGGGTLDISIFQIYNEQIKIFNISGDSNIGGRDFDHVIFDYIKHRLNVTHQKVIPKDKGHKVLLMCQKIKENLSVTEEDAFDVSEIDPSVEDFIPVKRECFENLSLSLMEQIKNFIENAIKSSNLKIDQIDKVLHVGGGCRMPMIKNLLKEIFPNAEQYCDKHPDEIVAIGAAYCTCFSAANESGLYGPADLSFKEIHRRNSI